MPAETETAETVEAPAEEVKAESTVAEAHVTESAEAPVEEVKAEVADKATENK